MNMVFFVILALFAVVGAAHIVFEIFYNLTKIKDDNAFILIIPQIDKNFDAEFALRSVIAKIKKLGSNSINKVICINNGLNENALMQCGLLADEYSFIEIMTKEQFREFSKL